MVWQREIKLETTRTGLSLLRTDSSRDKHTGRRFLSFSVHLVTKRCIVGIHARNKWVTSFNRSCTGSAWFIVIWQRFLCLVGTLSAEYKNSLWEYIILYREDSIKVRNKIIRTRRFLSSVIDEEHLKNRIFEYYDYLNDDRLFTS